MHKPFTSVNFFPCRLNLKMDSVMYMREGFFQGERARGASADVYLIEDEPRDGATVHAEAPHCCTSIMSFVFLRSSSQGCELPALLKQGGCIHQY